MKAIKKVSKPNWMISRVKEAAVEDKEIDLYLANKAQKFIDQLCSFTYGSAGETSIS